MTHYDPEEEIDVTPTELFHLTRKLELLAKVCLLQEAGFGHDMIEKTMSGRVQYRELFQSSQMVPAVGSDEG